MIITILAIFGGIFLWALSGHIGFWIYGDKYKDLEDIVMPSITGLIFFIFVIVFVYTRFIIDLIKLPSDVAKIKKKLKIK